VIATIACTINKNLQLMDEFKKKKKSYFDVL